MSIVWVNFSETPTNGLALISHNVPVHLPADSEENEMRAAWSCMEDQHKVQLPEELYAQCYLRNHALLTWLVSIWMAAPTSQAYKAGQVLLQKGDEKEQALQTQPPVSSTFVMDVLMSKLFPEVIADCGQNGC
jgi:hypothetical protein